MKSPIFLFSLPRSGSTLLQRILMSHSQVTSVAEPWILLPFVYCSNTKGTVAEYGHASSSAAISDFIGNLPKGESDYNQALRLFIDQLYEKQCGNNEKYFLDKTPRYYNIIPEIAEIFPDAKFIFLFRNPLHVMSSIINTWNDGRLKWMFKFKRDLEVGPGAITDGYELLKEKAYAIQYEKFVQNPDKYTREICDYLEITFDKKMLNKFSTQNTKGRMGDPTGVSAYQRVDKTPLEKWKQTFNSRYRKKYAINYIKKLSENTLARQGYDKSELYNEIRQLPETKKSNWKDRLDIAYSKYFRIVKPNIWRKGVIKEWAYDEFLS